MNTYSIFLASSKELLFEREKFEIFINRRNGINIRNNVRLELKIWETISGELGIAEKQLEYNAIVEKADILVLLFWSKIGKFTKDEYETANRLRKKEGKPLVYIYQKTAASLFPTLENEDVSRSLFIKALEKDGKFPIEFKDHNELERKFNYELDLLFENNTFKYGRNESIFLSISRVVRKLIGISLFFVSMIMFFFRRDVIYRWNDGDPDSPIQELVTPVFLLILGALIFIFKLKRNEKLKKSIC